MTAPLLERVRKSEFLGREFLLWLWFRSETDEGGFNLDEIGHAKLWFDRKIVLQSEGDHGVEKIVCSGDHPHLREARFALTEDKEITEAMVKLLIGDHEWSFVLDSTWLNFKSFKIPKIMQDREEDPDGFFYEKMFLIEKAISSVDAIYRLFIKLRLSPEWESGELPALLDWIKQGK